MIKKWKVGWMDGWMDEWMNGEMVEWMDMRGHYHKYKSIAKH